MWVLLQGLKMATEMGFQKIIAECDNEGVYPWLTNWEAVSTVKMVTALDETVTNQMNDGRLFHQYQVVGRGLPTENDEHPKIYRMKLWATNEVRAKSKFWYFLRKLKKVKKSNGQVLAINEIFEKNPTKIKNYGIWLRYQSRTGYHNMYKEYRDTTLNGAVEQMYNEMASRHRVRFPCIQIIKTATIPAKLCKRESTKQFHNSKIKFPLVFKKVENVQSVVLWICAGAISPYLLSWKLIAWWSGMRVYCQSCGLV
ncbi:hypothetical protein GH714_042037 [Hevea brasiliensis]|uniref:Large ribosomal subunit protein eL20 domain-containing protein n=1 Tax=Hevea brasiliensis TaxID=3981 RepID=A0A6A6MWJ4_HEVBR|nr:hypothetical protein GH714_042037 [Hevea brasiliensis]